ncbi:MAG: adenine deaminase [Bacteroidia bacterium]|nr:adenine deaminase [Bacteroidia bacterium]
MKVCGQLIDIHKKDIYPAIISILKGKINKIERTETAPDLYIMPGLIDAHIHIESSMITPGAFAMTAVKHGTIGVVSDPHEIANILGGPGVRFMIDDAEKVPLRFWFGASSCVPATNFETSGATLNSAEVKKLMELPKIKYLAEMMNFPGVINGDKEVLRKLDIARKLGKPIDGHAPGLTGEMLRKYVAAGISTDHECSTLEEAKEKISLGMKILIREGSAARNLNSLKDLFYTNPEKIMLCSDDLHPEMLEKRHINKLVGSLISDGFDVFDVIRSATINPVKHYNLEAGLLQQGENADFILVDSLKQMNVLETWIGGEKVFADGKVLFSYTPGMAINNFKCLTINESVIRVTNKHRKMRVIKAFEGELLTKEIIVFPGTKKFVASDIDNDILKIVVKDRYNDSFPVIGFIKGFGLKHGAFASSIAHDSHNIISVGTNDRDITNSVNEIVKQKGGLAVSSGGKAISLQLNIGGIMTTRSCREVAQDYEKLNELVKSLGCTMAAPFMTLSFMALLVIPDLKIGDRGLFDVNKFELVSLFVD